MYYICVAFVFLLFIVTVKIVLRTLYCIVYIVFLLDNDVEFFLEVI